MYSGSDSSASFRARCSVLRTYPLHCIDVLQSFQAQVPSDSAWLQIAHNVEQYEEQLSKSDDDDIDARMVRHLLGDSHCGGIAVTMTDRLRTKHSEKVSALLALYRIFDYQVLQHYDGSILQTSRLPVPQMINRLSDVPRHTQRILARLEVWNVVIAEFQKDVDEELKRKQPTRDLDISSESKIQMTMAHLRHLGDSHFAKRIQTVVQNFREASLHYTFLQEIAASQPSSLPNIPETYEEIGALILSEQEFSKYDDGTCEKIKTYLAANSLSGIRLPFQTALLISMVILLLPISLNKYPFPRGTLNTLSCAIGNQKPKILVRVELEIWKTISIISKDSSSSAVLGALSALTKSEAFIEAMALPSTNPAFSFFKCSSPGVSSAPLDTAGPSRSLKTSVTDSPTPPPPVFAAAPVNFSWPSHGFSSSPQSFRAEGFFYPTLSPSPVYIPGPIYHRSGIPASQHMYNNFGPNPTMPFPFVSSNAPIHTSRIAPSQMIPFTPSNVATPSRIFHPIPANSADVTMICPENSKDDDEGTQTDGDKHFEHELQFEPVRYDDNEMGVARALSLNDAMAHNGTTAIGSVPTGDGEGDDDSGAAPSVQHHIDASLDTHPENAIQHDSDGSDSLKEFESSSTSTHQVIGPVGNAQGNAATSDNEGSDDHDSMPQAIRRNSRTNKKAKVSETVKLSAHIVGQRTDRAKKSAVVVNYSVHEIPADVTTNPLQLSWKQMDDDIFLLIPELTLSNKTSRKVLRTDRVVTAWGPSKEDKLEFNFIAHDSCKQTLTLLESLVDLITCNYQDGMPLHLVNSGPKKSIFAVLTESQFRSLTDSQVQDLLRQQHIVVTGIRHDSESFEGALELLAPLNSVKPIQDQSLPFGDLSRTRIGKVRDILDATEPSHLKILNALSFPKLFAGVNLSAYSSDAHALMSVSNQEGWAKRSPITPKDIRWGLAATEGAFHHWHIDSDGFGTFIEPVAGAKWWIVARPPTDDLAFDIFNKPSLLFDKAFDLNKSGKGLFAAEAILLQPGTRLIMRPNTLHAVYTPQHAVCDGGHFYATSTIRDTFVGLVHTFMCDQYITNIAHFPSRFILAQMINFYHSALVKNEAPNAKSRAHVPDPMNPTSFMDLIIICGLGALTNVLSFQTYMAPAADSDEDAEMTALQAQLWDDDDVNHMSEHDRKLCCLARGQSLDIISWLSANFRVTNGDTESPKELFASMLLDMCKMIVSYKDLADSQKVKHRSNFTSDRLRIQITTLLSMPEITCPQDPNKLTWKFSPAYKNSCLMLPSWNEPYELEPILGAQVELKSIGALCKAGETERDRKFATRMEMKHEHNDNILPNKKRKRDT